MERFQCPCPLRIWRSFSIRSKIIKLYFLIRSFSYLIVILPARPRRGKEIRGLTRNLWLNRTNLCDKIWLNHQNTVHGMLRPCRNKWRKRCQWRAMQSAQAENRSFSLEREHRGRPTLWNESRSLASSSRHGLWPSSGYASASSWPSCRKATLRSRTF